MATTRVRVLRSALLPMLALIVLVLSNLMGCSGGGGGSASTGSQAAGPATAASQTGRVSMVVKRDAAKQANLIPAGTTAIRVTVLGTSIVQVVDFPPGATQVEVVLEGVPIGTRTLLIEALQGTEVVARGQLVIAVSTNTVVESAVTLVAVSPTPTPTVSPTATPAGSKLAFTVQPPPKVAANFMFGNGQGGAATIEVSIYDANGNLDVFNTDPVTLGLASNPAGATLTSLRSLTATPVGGKATFFSLFVATPASGLAMVAKNSTLSGTSQPFDCVSASLTFTNTVNPYQQSNVVLSDDLGGTLQAAVVDVNGAVVPYVRETASLGLGSNPGAATISNGDAALIDGLAKFPDAAVVGVSAPCTLQVSSSQHVSSPVTIDVLPTTTTGAIFVGAQQGFPATARRVVMYDVRLLKPKFIDVAYVPKAMVVGGGNFLYVGGDDSQLHVYSTVDLTEVTTPITLSGVPELMRQDPASSRIFISETAASKIEIVDTTNAPTSFTIGQVTGLTNVHALGVSDPATANPFLLDITQISTTADLQHRLLNALNAPTTYGTMFASVSGAYLDFTKSNLVGLMTYGSGFLPASFNPSRPTTTFGGGGFANAGERRVDVRFYKETSGAVEDGTCLVANDATGQVEVAYVNAVLPQPNASPPLISNVQNAADPRGLVGASGAEYIALEVGTDGVTNASAFVTDFSRSRLLVLDLAPAVPQIISSVPMLSPSDAWSPTAITTHQLNIPSTH